MQQKYGTGSWDNSFSNHSRTLRAPVLLDLKLAAGFFDPFSNQDDLTAVLPSY